MKLTPILLMASMAICFERTEYDFLAGKSSSEIRGQYLGLHKDYL